ncbi:MAG: hypothetical protein U5J99_08140 [Parvularculaceae bacterium]|nr:hypothetical protein [Parvularculaceae bacterium]
MKKLIAAALAAFSVLTGASAQPWIGHEVIYEGPTPVNLAGRPVVADIALHADMKAASKKILRVALVTDVTTFVDQTEADLENWIATRQAQCGERWRAGEPLIEFPQGAIRFALDLEIDYWTCGVDGKAEPSRLAHETGRVDVTLIPYVEDGKLQARLGDFSIDNRTGVSRYLPLEFIVRGALDQEIARLNKNTKFYRAPKPFLGFGYKYESMKGEKKPDGRVIITARYRGAGEATAYQRLAAKMREAGISQ